MRHLQQMAGHAVRRAVLLRVPRRPGSTAQASRRGNKMAVARLGGDGRRRRRRRFLGTMLMKRLRLRWMAALYRRALRRLHACYAKAIQDVLEGAALFGTVRADAGV